MFNFRKTGILGINARNLLYIKPYNDKKAIVLADDKLRTKAFLSTRGVPVPKLYALISSKEALDRFDFQKLPSSFVIKPNKGFGGEGIIPIVSKQKDIFIAVDGKQYTKKDLIDHIRDILDGRYSITGNTDTAFFEQLITSHETLAKVSHKGLPDIRVVVHNLIPVMAMLRLPTKESAGKANLHQGAIGAGIDLSKGEVTHVLYKNKIVKEIQGIGPIKGLKIPYWDDILLSAIKCQLATNLGYMAADIAIDKNSGPILLEINARAGLGLQIANLAPLRRRLESIKNIKVKTPEKGLRIAKDLFGRAPEKKIVKVPEKPIITNEESVDIILKDHVQKVNALVHTGRERSKIDEDFARENGLLTGNDYNSEKSTLKLKFSLAGKRIQTIVDVKPILQKTFKMVLGLRDLENFLIAPKAPKKTATNPVEAATAAKPLDYRELDQKLIEIEKKVKLLYYVRPLNLQEEHLKFLTDFSYNPQFVYPELKFDPKSLKKKIAELEFDDSPLGVLLQKKAQDVLKKIKILESRGTDEFTVAAFKLFGKPTSELIKITNEILAKGLKEKHLEHDVSDEEAKDIFTKALNDYHLKKWKVEIREGLIANCIAGKQNKVFIKKNARFSRNRIENLIIHEIETHVLTAENGKHQPYQFLNRGGAGYLETQEGLALYNVRKYGHEGEDNRFSLAATVKATELAYEKGFAEIFQALRDLGLSTEKAFKIVVRVKRGLTDTSKKGAFAKDYLYLKGLRSIEQYVENGGSLKDLYLGKFHLDDLGLIKQIPELKEPKILPKWLTE